ncbi:MAG: Fe-S oxidoreductase, partial [Planctomycetota bacterium]|nr:Fe-S oxidoreductase [Planctomycetota bacterium]
MSNDFELFAEELKLRMGLPQRHRLLHGYPMAPLMEPCAPKLRRFKGFENETQGLILGVLPHPFCNPKLEGCGFCTFPHSQFNKEATLKTCAAVVTEIQRFKGAHPRLCERPIEAIYFGG